MSTLENMSPRKRMLLLVAWVVIVCAVLFALAEGLVRVRHYLKYGGMWGVEDTYMTDETSGLRIPVPNSRFGSITINSLGFRSPELAQPKPDDGLRLAFLGASTTYCAEVSSDEMTWPHLVWKRLSELWPMRRVDYINAGVPGYGVEASLRNLEYRVGPLQPDIIFIYHATNDLSSNSYDMASEQGLVSARSDEELSWLSGYSLLWFLAEKNIRLLLAQAASNSDEGKLVPDMERLAEPFRRELAELVAASRQVADTVVLLTFSHHIREGQSPGARSEAAATNLYYTPYMTADDILKAYDAYNGVIRSVAQEQGVLLLDIADEIPGTGEYFHDSVHFTDAGSRLMAEKVVERFLESGAARR